MTGKAATAQVLAAWAADAVTELLHVQRGFIAAASTPRAGASRRPARRNCGAAGASRSRAAPCATPPSTGRKLEPAAHGPIRGLAGNSNVRFWVSRAIKIMVRAFALALSPELSAAVVEVLEEERCGIYYGLQTLPTRLAACPRCRACQRQHSSRRSSRSRPCLARHSRRQQASSMPQLVSRPRAPGGLLPKSPLSSVSGSMSSQAGHCAASANAGPGEPAAAHGAG